jgi:hypothetical protein
MQQLPQERRPQELYELKLNKHDLGLYFSLDTKQHQP